VNCRVGGVRRVVLELSVVEDGGPRLAVDAAKDDEEHDEDDDEDGQAEDAQQRVDLEISK
jgi:hypothetical protein